jgi:hypothetical protein
MEARAGRHRNTSARALSLPRNDGGTESCRRWLAHNVSRAAPLAHAPRRGGLRRVFELITFGFELEMLTLHMRILQPEVAGFLVAEATSTYQAVNQGDLAPSKPAVLSAALANGTFPAELAAAVRVRVLRAAEEVPRCKAKREARVAGPHGCWEAVCEGPSPPTHVLGAPSHQHRCDSDARRAAQRHRAALLELLLEVATQPDDLAMLADVDEIASPRSLHALRRCASRIGAHDRQSSVSASAAALLRPLLQVCAAAK